MPLHLFIVHFPVALLVTGAGADLVGALTRNERVRAWAGWLLVLGGVMAFAAFLTGGDAMARAMIRIPAGDPRLEAHAQWGGAGVWLLAGGAVLRALWRERLEGAQGWLLLGVALLSAAAAVSISLSGTAISHGG